MPRPKTGWTHSPEARAKISAAKKGKPSSQNHKDALADHHARRNAALGILSPLDKRGMHYGLGPGDYTRMLNEQGARCKICDHPERKMRNGQIVALAIDHCHETGEVRGLLCFQCNMKLGVLEAMINDGLLFEMLRYLGDW